MLLLMTHQPRELQWPTCEECGGKMWTLKRKPVPGAGVEVQTFSCFDCDHVLKRPVDDELTRVTA
jgi:hypothetical protein